MPIGASVTLRGTVVAASAVAATLSGSVANPALTPATLTGEVSRAVVESVDGDSIAFAWMIKLAGEWIPAEDLVGPLELEETIDSPVRLATFGLRGSSYSILQSIRAWTRTPVEIWTGSGTHGSFREVLRLSGYVLTCDQADGYEPVLRVRCGDQAVLYDRWELCLEVEPGSGLTRDEILASLLADAGIVDVDLAPGRSWDRPLFTNGQTLFTYIQAFGEPEGWSYRFVPGGPFQSFVPRLKLPPEPPDHVWALDDVLEVEPAPPRDVASRWIVRGTAAVFVDESGLETEVTRTEIQALYAVKYAVQMQNMDGTLTNLNPAPQAEILRTVQILEDQRSRRGGKDVLQITREWRYFNPAAAKLKTGDNPGDPPGPAGGYYYAQAFVDPDGHFVAWTQESLVQVGERRRIPRYDVDGNLAGARTETFRFYRKTEGVKNTGSATNNVLAVGIGDDDESYFPFERALTALLRIEEFGLAQVDEEAFTYGAAGAVVRELQDSYGFVSPRTAIAGNPWYILASGQGQLELVAGWRKFQSRDVRHLLSQDGHVAGQTEVVSGYAAIKRLTGAYDYGDFKSNAQQQSFQALSTKLVQYNQVSESVYEEVVYSEAGRVATLIPGRLPLPRYKGSVWTRLVQQPIELVIDDPVLEAWFGFRRQVLQHEFVQTLDEARALLLRQRSRALAFKHAVSRLRTNARAGDTVLLVDPRHGIHHRCLIAAAHESWELAPRTAVLGRYDLEQPL